MTTAKDKSLATVEPTTTALALTAFEEDMGSGFEDTSASDYAIPFFVILQAMSPQCTMGKPQYNEDLRPGMFFNSVTEEHFSGKEGVDFIPAKYLRVGTLWEPGSNDGTGFKGTVSVAELEVMLQSCTKDDKGHDITQHGLMLVDTRQWYGLLVKKDGTFDYVLLPLKSTQLKKSKRWLSLAQNLKHNGKPLPLSSQMYHLTTVPEQNDKGAWMGLEVKHVGVVPNMDLYNAAKHFREMIDSGVAKPVEPEGSEGNEVPF